MNPPDPLDQLRWNDQGLLPAIVQDAASGEVLMLAWMNREALEKTRATGQSHFFSRSRGKLWHKGDTSGHLQHVHEIRCDCDADVILLRVRQVGGACHEGYRTCFFRVLGEQGALLVTDQRMFEPANVYPKSPAPG